MQYTVKAGDSLSKIALQFNQPLSAWRALYDANQAQIKNPDLIYPGQVLNIPKNWNVNARTPPILPPGASSPSQTNPAAAGEVVAEKSHRMLFILGGVALTLFLANRKPKKRRRR